MPLAEHSSKSPLALDVLREEMSAIDAQFGALRRATDAGEREARRSDLVRSIDRYLRLEQEVFLPVLGRKRIDAAAPLESGKALRNCLHRLEDFHAEDMVAPLQTLQAAWDSHRDLAENRVFPRAAQQLADELPGLAHELEEVRSRLKGTYGV